MPVVGGAVSAVGAARFAAAWWVFAWVGLAVAGSWLGVACASPLAAAEDAAELEFRVEGRVVRRVSLGELRRVIPSVIVSGYDPYYLRPKRFRALPLEAVLAAGFAGESLGPLKDRPFVLRARDGYTVPLAGERLLEGGAHVAFADDELGRGFEPIGERRADPAPFYLVWAKASQASLETHPRPWQLAVLEVARFEVAFPHTAPADPRADTATGRGFRLFARECVRCHAVNREGGRVGPELNVPRNITEYRPLPQLREFIRNPRSFRYSAMPPHPHLSERDLDDLLAYLVAMVPRKHDPEARP